MVLLGAVLIVALAVVALLGISTSLSGDASITEAQLYWRSVTPLSVLDAKNLDGWICSGTNTYGYRLVVTNSDSDPVYITGIGINGVSKTFCTEGAANASSRIEVGTGKTVKIDVLGSNCTLGSAVEFPLAFTYSTPYLEGKREAGAKKFAFKCGEPTTANPPCVGAGEHCEVLPCCGGLCKPFGGGGFTCQ